MKMYIKPLVNEESVNINEIILASLSESQDAGEGEMIDLGNKLGGRRGFTN